MNISARRAAVLGSPIAHSLSPVLHRTAYDVLALPDWEYGCHDVDEAGLPAFLERISADPVPWAGLSLTMPLKRAVIPLLDEISATAATSHHASAARAGINSGTSDRHRSPRLKSKRWMMMWMPSASSTPNSIDPARIM